MSLEALKGSSRPFDERLQAARPHPGQAVVARNMRALLAESEIAESHRDCGKVQDAYSLRCMPQVHGATRDALGWVRGVHATEINSVTDNPSVFLDDQGKADLISGGNFHGQPLALALDLAAIAVAELANISERRVEQLVNPALSTGLTPFLAAGSGLHSGFMIAQVASASLVSENKVLCHPASVDSIPSSAGKEDHVSMGSVSARKLVQVVTNVKHALAIEIMTAAAGIDQRGPLKPSRGVAAAHAVVRSKVAPMTEDRPLYKDIEAVAAMLVSGELVRAAEKAVGALG
jgi:histidine ammonia-lyase